VEILGTIPWEEVIRTWLDSEWYRLPGNIVDRGLVDNPDLADAEENSERLTALCLYLNRAPLLSPVPTVTVAELANIEQAICPDCTSSRVTIGIGILTVRSCFLMHPRI
jgi:hypothetical protein